MRISSFYGARKDSRAYLHHSIRTLRHHGTDTQLTQKRLWDGGREVQIVGRVQVGAEILQQLGNVLLGRADKIQGRDILNLSPTLVQHTVQASTQCQ